MTPKNLHVTKPLLPDIDQLPSEIKEIYERNVATNAGPIHQLLERNLHPRLGGTEFALFKNGTFALLAALASLDLPKGAEVITTPFTFAATSHVISYSFHATKLFNSIEGSGLSLSSAALAGKMSELHVHVGDLKMRKSRHEKELRPSTTRS